MTFNECLSPKWTCLCVGWMGQPRCLEKFGSSARHYFSILAAQGPLPLPQHPSSLQGSSLKAAPALFSLSTLPLVTFTEVSKVKM